MEVVDIDVEANQGAKSFEASGTGQGQSQGRRGFFAPLAQAKSKIQSVKAWGKGKIKPVDDGESELLKKISAYTDKQLHAGEALQHLKEKKRFNFDMQFGIYIVHFCFFLATVLLFIPVHFSFEQVDLVTIYFSQDQNEEYLNIESVTTKVKDSIQKGCCDQFFFFFGSLTCFSCYSFSFFQQGDIYKVGFEMMRMKGFLSPEFPFIYYCCCNCFSISMRSLKLQMDV
eukprot:TRINITY_DN4267_c0_g1_i6.p1 TRINITY_DN4267_c0_g1~~TRINITY_DN4267_c0_g1_i6.p1  ORF type:complete len:228 (-),score=27.04 TRINITY_DN4267_c0_g1_i6:12-695(-)